MAPELAQESEKKEHLQSRRTSLKNNEKKRTRSKKIKAKVEGLFLEIKECAEKPHVYTAKKHHIVAHRHRKEFTGMEGIVNK